MGGTIQGLPIWTIPAIIAACFGVCSSCVALGLYFSRFVTHPVCKNRMEKAEKNHDEDIAHIHKDYRDEKGQRRAVWKQVSETRESVIEIHSALVTNGLIPGK